MLFSKFCRELSCDSFRSAPKPSPVVLREQRQSALHSLVFADDMRGAPAQKRRQIALRQFVRRNIAQGDQTERFRGGARFFASLVVEAIGQLALCPGFGNDQSKTRRKWNCPHFLAPRIKENRVLGTAKNGRDLIEQTGLHPDEPMVRALAELRDLEWRQGRRRRV